MAQTADSCFDIPKPKNSGVATPTGGMYNVVSVDLPTGDGGTTFDPNSNLNPVFPLSRFSIVVLVEENVTDGTTQAYVEVTTDGYRLDVIPLDSSGTFYYIHGNRADGTVCPTDGYSISGVFTSATSIAGHFQYVPACACENSGDFVASPSKG